MKLNRLKSRASSRGFTLVEILIVVIILGILAAIVVPQFSNASQDARKASLVSQLQAIRGQINLYALQHNDQFAPSLIAGGTTAWDDLIQRTNPDHTTTGTPRLGPYLQAAPINNLNGSFAVFSGVTTDLALGATSPGAATDGFLFNAVSGKIWATSAKGGRVYDEGNPSNVLNVNE